MMKGFRSVGLIAAAGLALSSTAAFADELRIVSWGGAYQKGQSIGIFQPAKSTNLAFCWTCWL